MSATLAELAEKYGVSKVTAKARLVSAGLWDGHISKSGRAFVVDDEAIDELDRLLMGSGGRGRHLSTRSGNASDSDQLISELRETVAYLKKQLAEKDEQIARRDEQINKLIDR